MKIQQVFLVIAVAATLAALPTSPAVAQPPPDLPDVESLVAGRRAIVEGWLGAEPGARNPEGKNWRRLRSLIIDRIELSTAYGNGLTITDEDNGNTISNFKTQATWSIKYTVPLKELFDFGSARELARAKHEEALRAEEIAIRMIHNDYLKARSDYLKFAISSARSSPVPESGFEMRALALKLLILTEKEERSDTFSRWNGFLLPDAGSEEQVASK